MPIEENPDAQSVESRLENLRQDLEDLRAGADPSLPPVEVADATLRAFAENASTYARLPLAFLAACGVETADPESLDEEQVRRELWRLIWHLALLGLHLDHTDLLSDRELYAWLLDEGLREPVALLPGDEEPREFVVDPLGDFHDPEVRRVLLVSFADEFDDDEREHLARGVEGPVEPAPRPHDRDRFLP